MKISLLFPRFIYKVHDPPLGISYLASMLRQAGFGDVEILDGTFETWQECLSRIKAFKPGILGMSVQTVYSELALKFAGEAKQLSPETLVVFGGPHPTVLPLETMQNPFVDVAVLGEGEDTIVELAQGKEFQDIPGIAYRRNGEIIFTPRRQSIQNLDLLHFPAWDLLSPSYFKHGSMSIMASRGCPFNCSFCQPALNQIFTKKVRFRSPQNIVQEIFLLKQRYGIDFVTFHDDTFVLNKRWVMDLCRRLVEEKAGVKWICNARADLVDSDILEAMKSAGCQQLSIGVESGDPTIRNVMLRKNLSEEKIISCFRLAREKGLSCCALLMVGSPGETMSSISETLELLDKIEPRWGAVYVTTPLPGTYLYSLCQEKELIRAKDYKDIDYYKGFSTLKLENFTPIQLKKIRASLFLAIIAHRLFPFSYRKLYKFLYPFSNVLENLIDFSTPILRTFINTARLGT